MCSKQTHEKSAREISKMSILQHDGGEIAETASEAVAMQSVQRDAAVSHYCCAAWGNL
jgi:hypothetical protein